MDNLAQEMTRRQLPPDWRQFQLRFALELIALLRGFAESLLANASRAADDRVFFQCALKFAVENLGVSRTSLADAFGMNVATVGRWVSGTSLPAAIARPVVIAKIAQALNLRATDIEAEFCDVVCSVEPTPCESDVLVSKEIAGGQARCG